MLVDSTITIKPIWYDSYPNIIVAMDSVMFWNGPLTRTRKFNFITDVYEGEHVISVKFLGKTDLDCQPALKLDKAVIIDNVSFFDISSKMFIWEGKYTPIYSDSYVQSLANEGRIPEVSPTTYGYMGWNGTWSLTFTVPIFTWIHKVEKLGWIYP